MFTYLTSVTEVFLTGFAIGMFGTGFVCFKLRKKNSK